MTHSLPPLKPRKRQRPFADSFNPADSIRMRRALLGWHSRHSRSLPWQKASAYGVWVSEVMLQQTQISTVIPYYLRFMKAFPTIHKLAAGPLERVLELWSGLGYYRRARLLHQAAQVMVERFDGKFPKEYESARTLPGVGDYTARAVLSIAFQKPLYVVDGNVARVIGRILALPGNIHQKPFRATAQLFLEQLLSRRRPGDFNQAIMQLGQLVCTPASPQCASCPIREKCKAYLLGSPESYPAPRPRRATERHFLASAVLKSGNEVALARGLDDGLLDDLWNFPSCFGPDRKAARSALSKRLAGTFRSRFLPNKPSATLSHNITHRTIQVDIYTREFGEVDASSTQKAPMQKSLTLTLGSGEGQSQIEWMPITKLRDAAISRLTKKIAAAAKLA